MLNREELRQPVECIIRVDDQEITGFYRYLRSVSVDTSRRAAAVCELSFDTVRDASGAWSVQDSPLFVPWRKIRIEAAFGSHIEEVMRGYIKEIKAEYPADRSSAVVTVSGQDESLLLDRAYIQMVRSSSSQPQSDGMIVEQIARQRGFAAKTSPGLKNTSLNQDETEIRFLLRRAEANGYELLVREGTIYFGPPELEGEAQATILVYAGAPTNCLAFSVGHEGHQPDQVRLASASETGPDAETETFSCGLKLLGRSSADSQASGLDPFVWNLRPSGASSAERRARAQAKANEAAWKLTATGELDGALYGHVLLTHRTVTVDGIGETYGGVWYVDEVKHEFSAEGYREKFRLLRNATGDTATAGGSDRLAMVR